MKIKQLLQPIAPPPQGLEKLQQALELQQQVLAQPILNRPFDESVAQSGHPLRSWHWQAAAVLLIGVLLVGARDSSVRDTSVRDYAVRDTSVLLSAGELPYQGEPMVVLTLPSPDLAVVNQSALVGLPSSDPQVKMYWVMSGG
ncbi:MAG: hypothetical protein KKA56_14720 [Gammaproteobacteria bacterium]|nr:hypothetical protein [Gammaproteobacteria bacterium]